MLFALITVLHWIVNFIAIFIFILEFGWYGWANNLYSNVKDKGLINTYCRYGIKIKHLFIFWLFIYDFILLILIVKLMKIGEITILKIK